jgi:UDP-2,4-diacetamido-2,4,6-trideoxy-beta-L-altropyranose hydrolase
MPDVGRYNPNVRPTSEDDVPAMQAEAGEMADLIVIDHYGRDVAFECACRPFARTILVFDDMTGRDHDCDVLIDAAASDPEQYRRHVPGQARVLPGPAYAIVRTSFVGLRPQALARRDGRPVRNILVSCGATDPFNATAAVLDALSELPADIAIVMVLSSKAPHIEAVRRSLRPGAQLMIDVDNMAGLIAEADLAIGAPGTTSYERAVLGLPSILLTLVDNQRGIAAMLFEAGAALDAGQADGGLAVRLQHHVTSLLGDAKARVRLSSTASRLVDGRGAMRVMLECVNAPIAKGGATVRLRMADASDEAWLLDLQRGPLTRRFYRNPAIPTAGEHHEWMRRTLDDPTKLLLMIEANDNLAGVLRLDRRPADNGTASYEVSIAIDAGYGNRGIGSAALGLIRRLLPGAQFHAEIAPENIASQRTFIRAGYTVDGNSRYRQEPLQ